MLKQRGFYRGINLGGWLSQCDYSQAHLQGFITEPDYEKIASWGMDHVRVPVDYNILQNDDGTPKEEGFALLEQARVLAQKYGMNLLIDLHKTAGFSFDSYGENEHGFFESAAYQERFCQLWEEIARRFGTYSKSVAFELLNEVTDKAYLPAWNQIVKTCIGRLRLIAPDTLILVGSYENNSARTVPALDPPFDANVIYNMHCYEPLEFTHQGAYWTEAIDPERRIAYEDSEALPAYFEELFAPAIRKAQENGTVLYCGEYGVIDRVPPEDTLAWFRAIHEVFERHGIARCAWTYKALDFGLTDPRLDPVREELTKLL